MKVSVSVSMDPGLVARIDAVAGKSRSEWIARELERALGSRPDEVSVAPASSRASKVPEAEEYVLPKIARRS